MLYTFASARSLQILLTHCCCLASGGNANALSLGPMTKKVTVEGLVQYPEDEAVVDFHEEGDDDI